jgi:hypothetical protein
VNQPPVKFDFRECEAVSYASVRSDLLDAFFDLEFQVARWLKLLGYEDVRSPFGNRLQSLIDHEKLQSSVSKKQYGHIRKLARECGELIRIRNAVVHSKASYGYISGEPAVFLQTLSLSLFEEGALLPMTYAQIKLAEKDARKIAGQLCLWYSQRSR